MTDSRSRLGILLGKIAFALVYKNSTNFQDARRLARALEEHRRPSPAFEPIVNLTSK